MTRYVDRNLHGDERVCHRGRVSWFAVLHRGVFALVLGVVGANVTERGSALAFFSGLAILLGLLGIVWGILFWLSADYAVTDRRVIGKYGLIRHQSVDVLLTSISGVSTSFTVLGRFFRYGTILVNASGTRRLLESVASPKAFEGAVYERLEESRLLKGTAAYTLNVQAVQPDGSAQPAVPTAPTPAGTPVAASFCGQCGVAITAGAQFCASCGAAV